MTMKRLLLLLTTLTSLAFIPGVSTQAQVLNVSSTREIVLTVKANYPNPYNEQTTILFSLNRPETIKITLYNILGGKISTILHEHMEAGEHQVLFKRPENLPDGIYLYTVEAGNKSRSMRMIIRK